MINGINPYSEVIKDNIIRNKYLKLLSELLKEISQIKIDHKDYYHIIENFYESYKYYYKIYEVKIKKYLNANETGIVEKLFNEYFNKNTYNPTLIHGDLSSDHVFLDEKYKNVTGVIDWGEACIGDPDFEYFAIYNDYGLDFVLELRKVLNLDCSERFINNIYLFSLCDIIEELDSEKEQLLITRIKAKIRDFI